MSSDLPPRDPSMTKKQWQRYLKQFKERQRLIDMAKKKFGPHLIRLRELESASAHGIIPAAKEMVELRTYLKGFGVID
jgi:hypothetical protein